VDPEGDRKWLVRAREKFEATVKLESRSSDATKSGRGEPTTR
jgi:hypothetical protein